VVLHLGTSPAGSQGPHGRLSDIASQELNHLATETDPLLREEGLLNLAAREESAGNIQSALELYSAVTETSLQRRAQRRIEALLGRGSLGDRAEILLRDLSREASNPASLISMGIASSVFRIVRLGALAELSSHSSANFFTRGLGARWAASLAGFALEAPAYTLSARALRASGDVETAQPGLAEELASSYLLLGALKLSGALGSGITRRFGSTQPFVSSLLRQSSLLGGIALGRRLEVLAHLRPNQDGTALLVDSLATLLNFHVSGRLAQEAFGPRFAAWEQGMEARSELLSRRLPPGGTPSLSLFEPSWSLSGQSERNPQESLIVMMDSDDPNSSDRPTQRPTTRIPVLQDPLRVTDLYMILTTLPRALRMPEPRISYDGDAWTENRDAAAIAGRLRAAIPLPRGTRMELLLIRQRQKVQFFWEGEEVRYRVEPEYSASPRSIVQTEVKPGDTLPAMGAIRPPEPAQRGVYSLHFGDRTAGENAATKPVAAADSSPQPSSQDWTTYEQDMDRRVEIFYRTMFAESTPTKFLEEASALRGRRLARIVNVAFKAESQEDTLPSIHPIESAINVQRLLEHAYGHFDFGTLQAFRERLTTLGGESFDDAVSLRNFSLQRAGRPLLLQAREMPLEFPGAYLIPRETGWRNAFLSEWTKEAPPEELARRVPELLKSPVSLAGLSSSVMRRRLNSFLNQTRLLQDMIPSEKLKDLLNPERNYRSNSSADLRDQSLFFLRETPEFARLLVYGRGSFHRQYIQALFFTGSEPLAEPYQHFLDRMQQLPAQRHDLEERRLFFPSLAQLRDFVRSSSRARPR